MKSSNQRRFLGFGLILWLAWPAGEACAVLREGGVYMMPLNCSELLPDSTPFTNFLEAVANGIVGTDRQLSRRIFRVLSLRTKLEEIADSSKMPNPVDTLIQKTICFYREQREPLKAISFDDTAFLTFLKTSFKDLEVKVDDAVYQAELDRFQRQEFERLAQKNRGIIESVQREANRDAQNSFERLSKSAKRKVQNP